MEMVIARSAARERREALASELAEATLRAVAPQGVRAPSIDLEIRLWKALGQTLGQLASDPTPNRDGCEDRLAKLALTAYEAALAQGIQGSFVDLEPRIWRELRQVIRRNRFLPAHSAELVC